MARPKMLPAYIEFILARRDVDTAPSAADEPAAIATTADAQMLREIAGSARGAVLLAQGDAPAAGEALRSACGEWE